MKSKFLAVLTMVLGVALSTLAFSQRHDEKPHGMGKESTESVDKERVPAGSGRHDEKPHGMKKKPAAKKDNAKAAADDKGSK